MRVGWGPLLLVATMALAGCAAGAAPIDPASTVANARAVPSSAPPALTPPAAPSPDELAGLLSRAVPQQGTAELTTVPGSVPAPGTGPVQEVRVEVENGLPVDTQAFADFVLATLNDDRSWGQGGAMTFARTDGEADLQVVLASPELSEELCKPLRTKGTLSCRAGSRAVITHYRWVRGHEDYATDPTGYRRYVINHEVGHFLGESRVDCPGEGEPAPVMQQQTFGLDGCTPNPWPYP